MIDRDKLLDMWADGVPIEEIAAAVGTLYNTTIIDLAAKARAAGDPRAVIRQPRRGRALKDRLAKNIGNYMHRKRLSKLPVDDEQIAACVASYTGQVTKLPTGFHAGHTPFCVRWLGG